MCGPTVLFFVIETEIVCPSLSAHNSLEWSQYHLTLLSGCLRFRDTLSDKTEKGHAGVE